MAWAQETDFAAETTAASIDFTDPSAALRGRLPATVELNVSEDSIARFSVGAAAHEPARRMELEIAAGGGGSPLDVSLAQRAEFGADVNGDVDRQSRGAELRIGSNLVGQREINNTQRSIYMFVASDNEALTWQPGGQARGAAVALQDQVEIGDRSAGVTYERHGVQASLAYVEREESTRVGNQSYSQDQSFAGFTLTMRR